MLGININSFVVFWVAHLQGFLLLVVLHVPVGRVWDEDETRDQNERDDGRDHGHPLPRDDRAQGVGQKTSQGQARHGNGTQPAAVVGLGCLRNEDLENKEGDKYMCPQFFCYNNVFRRRRAHRKLKFYEYTFLSDNMVLFCPQKPQQK